jgi:hypothetical protein|tara:strand:+ start:163 stop:525 length:363 start_codon:yes stop_codon:yes gene_type:complete
MVDILNKPLSQIVVRQFVKYSSPEVLARNVVVQAGASQSVSLTWVNGIAFKIITPPFIISELLAKEFVEGRLHVSLLYAEMDTFRPSIHAAEEKIQIPILDESDNKEAKSIADWLKQQPG